MTTIEFDKKCICGPEFVSIRIIDNCESIKIGNIWVPNTTAANQRLAFGKVESVGSKAAEEYGIKANDYVMFDRLSTFYHSAPVCVCRYENVICLVNENRDEYRPLKNMVFVEPLNKDQVTCQKGIYLMNDSSQMNIGTIVAYNLDESIQKDLNVEVGDKVLLTRNGDLVDVGNSRRIHIYKHNMLICKIED